jgi:hypothetical protein
MFSRKCVCGVYKAIVNLTLHEDQIKFDQIILKWRRCKTLRRDNT